MILTIRLRLKDKHDAELRRQSRIVNYVWNYCNETQQRAVRARRKWLSYYDLQKLTAGSSKMLDLNGHTIQKVCETYVRARAQHRKPWLRFRGRKSLGWVPFNSNSSRGGVRIDGRALVFRGVSYQPMHWRMPPDGTIIGAGSFNQDARGRWYINMPVEFPDGWFRKTNGSSIGVDLGLKDIAVLSTGERIEAKRHYRLSEKRFGIAQRAGKKRLARRIAAKVANQRKDYLHKVSACVALAHDLVFVGNVSSSALARTSMAKSVLDAGWSTFRKQLTYKAIRHGGRCIEVDEHLTSQTCSSCGALPPERPRGIAGLGIREWTCGGCGATHDRDVNAARNILARGLASLVEGAARMRSSHTLMQEEGIAQ